MDNLFQNVGLFLCVGGLIVVALVAFAVSSFMRRSRDNNQQPSVLNQRGNERPTYDSQRVESRGGFGGNVDTDTTDRPIPQTGRKGGGFGGARQFERDPKVDRDRKRSDDDDNISSSGGFGG